MNLIEMDDSYVDRFPGELSGGQKQRICIARALAAEPELIICDEVTSALDQIVQEGILKLLMRLQRELNVSYLFITHDIATVRAISDEIVVMFQGRVVQQGPKTKVLSPPHPPYTELLLSSVPEMDPDWLTNLLARRKVTPESMKAAIGNSTPSSSSPTVMTGRRPGHPNLSERTPRRIWITGSRRYASARQ